MLDDGSGGRHVIREIIAVYLYHLLNRGSRDVQASVKSFGRVWTLRDGWHVSWERESSSCTSRHGTLVFGPSSEIVAHLANAWCLRTWREDGIFIRRREDSLLERVGTVCLNLKDWPWSAHWHCGVLVDEAIELHSAGRRSRLRWHWQWAQAS